MFVLAAHRKCCCGGCTYFSAVPGSPTDGQVTFTDALGTLLTVDSGSWDITGTGRLRVTGPGRIIIEPPQPDGVPMHSLSFSSEDTTTGVSSSKVVRLLIDYLNGSNYHYVEGAPVDISTNSGKVAAVIGGSETVLSKGSIWFVDNSGFTEGSAGSICIQNGILCATGPSLIKHWFSSTIPYLAVQPSTATGGLKAALEVDQGASETMTFSGLTVFRQASLECPLPANYCGACMTVPGCHTIPDGGFMVTLSGITSGGSPTGDNCTNAAQFNGSFTLDEFGVFQVGHRQPGIGTPGPGGGTNHTGRVRGWRSAPFALSPSVACNSLGSPVTFTYGRIVLEPIGYSGYSTNDPPPTQTCKTGFRVHMIGGNDTESEDYLDWRWFGVLGPYWPYAENPEGQVGGAGEITSTGNSVLFACETIDGATFSGGGLATPFNTQSASFTIDAL